MFVFGTIFIIVLSSPASDSFMVAVKSENIAQPVVIEVLHLGLNLQGWEVAETSHFVIFHNQEKEFVEKVARVAEQTRIVMTRKWFGKDGDAWTPKCELFLHATGKDYTRQTGAPDASSACISIKVDPDSQRVVSRCIDLRCDIPGMVEAILPHETTHIALAGQFGKNQVPRWADEGIAVLSESKEKIDQHRRNLIKLAKERGMFGLKELMEVCDYPETARIPAFYAQSVCLVDFLTKERGPTVFTAFVRDGLREGYDAALRRHYKTDFAGLEKNWQKFLVDENKIDH